MKTFNFTQSTPSTTWTVTHNLDSRVTSDVSILRNGKLEKILPLSVSSTSSNVLVITFSQAVTGSVRIVASPVYPRT